MNHDNTTDSIALPQQVLRCQATSLMGMFPLPTVRLINQMGSGIVSSTEIPGRWELTPVE